MAGPDVHHERLDPLAKLGGSWHDLREVVRRGIHPLSGHELILRTISLVAECLRSNASSARVLASYDGTRWEWFGAASIFRPEYEVRVRSTSASTRTMSKVPRPPVLHHGPRSMYRGSSGSLSPVCCNVGFSTSPGELVRRKKAASGLLGAHHLGAGRTPGRGVESDKIRVAGLPPHFARSRSFPDPKKVFTRNKQHG